MHPLKKFLQQGGTAPQKPIKHIQKVATSEYKDNNQLPPGDYFKVFYVDPNQAKIENQDYEYVTPDGYKDLQRMNNFRIYNENAQASMQQGGNYYDNVNPFFMQNPGVQNPLYGNPLNGTLTPEETQGMENTYMNSNQQRPQLIPVSNLQPQGATQLLPDLNQSAQYGINQLEEQQNTPTDNTQVNYNDNFNLFNPYGGMDIPSAAYSLGAGIQNKNPLQTAGAAVKLTLGLGRNILSGVGNEKVNNYVEEEYKRKMREANDRPQYFQQGGDLKAFLQQGGQVTNADMLTGNFIADEGQGNVNIEKNEAVKHGDTGAVQKAVGNTHKQGGIDVDLADGSKVLSDYTKIGAENAKQFRKDFDIEIKATHTFADVLDKVNSKIGLKKLIEQEKELILQVEKQVKSGSDETTQDLNMQFLSGKLEELQAKKQPLEEAQSAIFEQIFTEQEKIPKKETAPGEILQEGGSIAQPTADQIIQAYAQLVQQDPQVLIQELQKLVPEQQQAAISQMMTALEQGQPQMAQQGGQFFTPSQYAQANYTDQPFIEGLTSASGNIGDYQGIMTRANAQNQNLPFLVRQSGLLDASGNIALNNVSNFQQGYDQYVGATLDAIDLNPNLSPEQKTEYKKIAKAQSLALSKKKGNYDAVYGEETSSRSAFTLPYLTPEDRVKYSQIKRIGDVVDEKGNIKADYSDLNPATKTAIQEVYKKQGKNALDIGISDISATETTNPTQQTNQTVNVDRNRTVLPLFPENYIPLPTPEQPVYKGSIDLGQLDPVKISAEPNLVALEAQRQAATQMNNTLTGSEAVANNFGTLLASQQGANQAISAVEAANATNAQKVQEANLNTAAKEEIFNLGQALNYEQRILQGKANTERDVNNYFMQNSMQNRQNWQDVNNLNLLNQVYPNYQTDGSNVRFNNQPLNFQTNRQALPSDFWKTYNSLNAAGKKAYLKKNGIEG